jgi:Na+-driven multidrug efflux pump
MGINGAALATAITFVSIILYLKILTYKSLRIKI